MSDRAKRDRPATNPGGMQCDACDEIFIGEEWHSLCAICEEARRTADAAADTSHRTGGKSYYRPPQPRSEDQS